MRKLLPFAVLVFACAPIVGAQRLPELATPESYQLTITPNLDKENFSADETIQIRVLKPTSTITLNAAEITFEEVTITSGGKAQAAKVALDEKKEAATFSFDQPLAAAPAALHIRYTGILNGQLRGFYLSKSNGRKYALTQLENTDARRMYPSFDEPAYKATFDITVIVDKGDTAISNGKIVSDTPGPGDGKHTLRFATTPKMSSYLVALAVGDWECLEGSADDIPIRICGVPGKKAYAGFALEAAEAAMKFYNQYFAIKYPYGKLDILGVPDFSAGAMENTAFIISRDLLFVDPKESSYQLRKEVAQNLVGHEMAHQWFGDLVTMKWWDDVWLNEGFATWMSFKATEAWKPEWNLQVDAVRSSTGAMGTDALSSTHAIEAHAETPADIEQLFDSIAYNKAAAVLRMVEGYTGEETFRKGVNSYLAKHAYGNATSENFWNEIAQVSHEPVDRIMSGFVKQPGVPLVALKTSCSGGNTKVPVAQQRFFADRARLEAGSAEQWVIPVCMKAGNAEKCGLLDSKQQQFEMHGCGEGVYGNAGGRGYYRSGYDAQDLMRLSSSVEKDLSAGERFLLLDDTAALVNVNRLQEGSFLTLAEAMRDDPSRAVIFELRDQLQFAGDYIVGDADRAQFEAWVRVTFGPPAEKMGWVPAPGESDETRARRADYLTLLGLVGRDPKAIQMSRELTDRALRGEPVDRTLLIAALPIAAHNGDVALYDAIIAHFGQLKTPEEYFLFGHALCMFSDPALLTRTLRFAVSPMMRAQDAPQVIDAVMANPAGRQLAWDFIRQNWAEVETKLSHYSETDLVDASGYFCDAAKRNEVQQFFTEHKVPASERALKMTLEEIDACIDMRAHQQANLQAWLQQQAGSGSGAPGSH